MRAGLAVLWEACVASGGSMLGIGQLRLWLMPAVREDVPYVQETPNWTSV